MLTNSVLIQGCTLRNQCDYVRQTGCPPGTGCYPTSDVGESVCLQRGTAAVGEPCSTANDCVAGATCASVSAARPGLCRPVCNPLEPVCPAGTSCRGFSERPGDWGYCDGR